MAKNQLPDESIYTVDALREMIPWADEGGLDGDIIESHLRLWKLFEKLRAEVARNEQAQNALRPAE